MTELIYMQDFDVVNCQAKVVQVIEGQESDDTWIVLDQTCFYPKGGGQDFDLGQISWKGGSLEVEKVFFNPEDKSVHHGGTLSGPSPTEGQEVDCKVNESRRALNTKLHSAGHIIDMAVRQLGYLWTPGKGAHYPDMSFVEYSAEDWDADKKETYVEEINARVEELAQKGSQNSIAFLTKEEMTQHGAHVPDNMPEGKPTRVVLYDDFAVPCGGTHVKDISILTGVKARKIKKKGEAIRVSYVIE